MIQHCNVGGYVWYLNKLCVIDRMTTKRIVISCLPVYWFMGRRYKQVPVDFGSGKVSGMVSPNSVEAFRASGDLVRLTAPEGWQDPAK